MICGFKLHRFISRVPCPGAALVKGGEQLIGALNFFVSSVNTLCNKTMEDSIDTVRRYESARLDIEKLLRVLLSRTLDFGNGTVVG